MAGKRRKALSRSKASRDIGPAEALIKAFNHPVRTQALTILTNRIASPRQIADILDHPLANVSYHVRVLEALGLVEIVEEEAVRGSVAHYFRSVERDRDDDHLVQTPLRMDKAGWAKVRRIQARAREEILKEQAAVKRRTNGSRTAATAGFFGHFLLEVPPEQSGDAR